ncbi:hypothetical protein SLEP1_g22589 [Rubroshorea leprosula]|uniref:Reverse transcriptase domain-containing protein n=1 Tax=Rubroshorea leprosula TaxID=152421 RepID=A0AAV5JKJ9_9ROSI|nr:hypothetical protein SLEP1_g22589 [Rubroshorea leprosula]
MVNSRSVRAGSQAQPLGQGQVHYPNNLPPQIPNPLPPVEHAEGGDENQPHNSAHNSTSTPNQGDAVIAQLLARNNPVLEVNSFNQAVGIAAVIQGLQHERIRDTLIKHPAAIFNEWKKERKGNGERLRSGEAVVESPTAEIGEGVHSGFAFAETKDWKPQTEATSEQQVPDFWLRSEEAVVESSMAEIGEAQHYKITKRWLDIAMLPRSQGPRKAKIRHQKPFPNKFMKISRYQNRKTQIGTWLNPKERTELIAFLRANKDVFAWTSVDMPGIPTSVSQHKLSTNPLKKPVAQKQCLFGGERFQVIKEEIKNLLNLKVYVDDIVVKSLKVEDHLADPAETFNNFRKNIMRLNPAKCIFGVEYGKFLGFMVSTRGIEVNLEKIKAIAKMESPKLVKDVQRLTGKVVALHRFISKSANKCLPFFKIMRSAAQKDEFGKQKKFEWNSQCQTAFDELKSYLSSHVLLTKAIDEKSFICTSPRVSLFLIFFFSPMLCLPKVPPKAAEASPGKELEFSLFFLDGEQGLNPEISFQPLARSALLLPRPCNPRKKPAAGDISLEKTGKAW